MRVPLSWLGSAVLISSFCSSASAAAASAALQICAFALAVGGAEGENLTWALHRAQGPTRLGTQSQDPGTMT